MRPRNRLVPLREDLPEEPGFPVQSCNYCAGEGWETRAVVAKEHQGKIHRYYGLCGNHAEVSGLSYEWKEIS